MPYCEDETKNGVMFPSSQTMEWFKGNGAVSNAVGCDEGQVGPCVFTGAQRLMDLFSAAYPNANTFGEMLDAFQQDNPVAPDISAAQALNAVLEMDCIQKVEMLEFLTSTRAGNTIQIDDSLAHCGLFENDAVVI